MECLHKCRTYVGVCIIFHNFGMQCMQRLMFLCQYINVVSILSSMYYVSDAICSKCYFRRAQNIFDAQLSAELLLIISMEC